MLRGGHIDDVVPRQVCQRDREQALHGNRVSITVGSSQIGEIQGNSIACVR
jgi:hypothetical protein